MSTRLVIKKSNHYYATHKIMHRLIDNNKKVHDILLAEINVNTGKITLYSNGMWNVPEVKLCDWTVNYLGLQVKSPDWMAY